MPRNATGKPKGARRASGTVSSAHNTVSGFGGRPAGQDGVRYQDTAQSDDAIVALAKAALASVLSDPGAPAAAKASAARTVLEMAGALGAGARRGGVSRSVSEMTADEIDAEIARLTNDPLLTL